MTFFKKRTKAVSYLIDTAIVLALVFSLWHFLSDYFADSKGPRKVADKFIEHIKNGELDKAEKLLSSYSKEGFSAIEDRYIYTFSQIPDHSILKYKLNNKEKTSATVTYTIENVEGDQKILLRKEEESWKVLWAPKDMEHFSGLYAKLVVSIPKGNISNTGDPDSTVSVKLSVGGSTTLRKAPKPGAEIVGNIEPNETLIVHSTQRDNRKVFVAMKERFSFFPDKPLETPAISISSSSGVKFGTPPLRTGNNYKVTVTDGDGVPHKGEIPAKDFVRQKWTWYEVESASSGVRGWVLEFNFKEHLPYYTHKLLPGEVEMNPKTIKLDAEVIPIYQKPEVEHEKVTFISPKSDSIFSAKIWEQLMTGEEINLLQPPAKIYPIEDGSEIRKVKFTSPVILYPGKPRNGKRFISIDLYNPKVNDRGSSINGLIEDGIHEILNDPAWFYISLDGDDFAGWVPEPFIQRP